MTDSNSQDENLATAPNILPPSNSNPLSSLSSHRRLVLIIAGVIAVALVGTGLMHQANKKTSNSKPTYAYTYKKLNLYKFAGPKSGAGVSISKPVELTPSVQTEPSAKDLQLTHAQLKDKKITVVSDIIISSFVAPAGTPDDYLTGVGQLISDSKNSQQVKQTLGAYLKGELGSTYSTSSIGDSKQLRTKNITKNAVYADFTATPKDLAQPSQKGRVIMSVGKNSVYELILQSSQYNWDSNQPIWQQVIDSLKVDQ